MHPQIAGMAEVVLAGRQLSREQAEQLVVLSAEHIYDLLYWANRIREHHFGKRVTCCAIAAARVGGCSEDCKFCSQSVWYRTHVAERSELDEGQILEAARAASACGAQAFGIVTSGRKPTDRDLTHTVRAAGRITSEVGMEVCASLGALTEGQARCLVEAGVRRYNHNMETSRSYFPKIVTTHEYDDRLATVRNAKAAGLAVCCGALFGMGETWADRLDVAFELRSLDVDAIPINFLHPIAGTPLADAEPIAPLECLRILGIFRFLLPDKPIKVAGGRERNLRDLQSWMFYAGATSFLIGNYLTTTGRAPAEDHQMIRDLGLEPLSVPSPPAQPEPANPLEAAT